LELTGKPDFVLNSHSSSQHVTMLVMQPTREQYGPY